MIASIIHPKKLIQFLMLFVFMTIAPFAVMAQAGDPDIPDFAKHKIDKQAFMEKRAEAINMMRGVRNGVTIDPQIRKMAIEQMQSQERALRGSGNNFVGSPWVPVGPAPIPNGQTQGGSVTAVSGRTTAIAVHPTNSNIVYAGVAQGGVYRTTNGGASWTPIFDAAESLAIGAITISPSNPEIVYVGTGEPNFSSDSYFGVGVYRIDNASTTANLSGPLNKDALNADIFSGRGIGNIVVHPTNPAIIFVSSTSGVGGIRSANNAFPSRGIYRCNNATSGSPVFDKLTGLIGNLNVSVRDIAIDPSNPNILIASPIATGTNQGGIYRTTNALASPASAVVFTQQLVTNSTSTSTLNAEFAAIHPSGDVDATFYAATGVSNGRVLKSTDGGATWVTTVTNGFCGGQCFYDIAIAVDPTNVNTVYLGGDPTLVAAKSVNGGTSFVESKVGLHVDTHVLTVDPSSPTTVWLGTDGGIYKSTNSGTTWTHQNTGEFSATQFMSIDAHPIDPNYSIGGTQDNGTNMYKPDGSWNRIDFGDGGYAVIDQNAVDNINVRMYHTYFNASNLQGYGTVSTTATASDGLWAFRGCQSTGATTNGITCTGTINFYAPLERGPGNPNTIYYGSDRLYRSADNGTTHTVVSQNPIVSGVALSSIGISPQNDNVRIVGLNNGVIFGTTTGSATLVDMDPNNAVPNLAIARTIIDPNNVNTAYVTLSGFNSPSVWKTTNLNAGAGIVWTNVSGTIPQIPANSIVIDPANSNNVFVGTDIGVYGSTNGGTSWVPYGTSLPRVAVFDMAITAGGKLRIATHGRGMWENQIICPAITVTNPATTTGTINTAFSQTFTQSGGATPVSFSTTSTLPTGLTLSAAGILSGTPTQIGTFPIVVTVTDNNGCTGTGGTYSLTINCQAITVTNPAITTGTSGVPFSQTFTQTGGVAVVTFSTASTLPTGLTLSAAGVLSGTPTQTGSFPIVVKATDANLCMGTGATYNLVISGAPCPTITVTNPATNTGTTGTAFSQTFTQSGGAAPVTFSTTSTLPIGLTLSTAGVLSGTPTQTGSFPIVVKATDNNGCIGNGATYTLTISCPTITITNPATTTGTIGTAFSQTFTQSGGAAPVTFSTTSTLPIGLSLSAAGVLSGTPTQTGTFPIVVTVTDNNGCTGTGATYSLVISAVPCPAITVTNPAVTTGTSGVAFSQTFTQTGGAAPVTFSTTSTLPTGLTLSAAGVLSGTPTQTGTFPIIVTATDANTCIGTGAVYNLVISGVPCPAITVTNPANNTGVQGQAFTASYAASGGTTPYTYATLSTLPAGITLSTAGVLSGTPTEMGTFTIRVTATDANSCTGTSTDYTLTIACPVFTVNPIPNSTVCVGSNAGPFNFSGSNPAATYSWMNNNTAIGLGASGNGNIAAFTGTNATAAPITGTVTVTPTAPTSIIAAGALLPGDATMPDRPSRFALVNTCAIPIVAPTPFASAGYFVDTYSYPNTTGAPLCVTVTYSTQDPNANVQSMAYLNAFNPNDFSQNYLGDAGQSILSTSVPPQVTYSFTLPTGGTAKIIMFSVNGTTSGTGTAENYKLQIDGFSCAGTPQNFNITVNPTPTVNQPTNQSVCAGQMTTAVNFTGTAGATYAWTNNNTATGLAASGTGNIAAFMATNATAAAITSTITVTPTTTSGGVTCTGAAKTFTITVNPQPTVNQPTSQIVCNNATTMPATFTGSAGSVFNWTNSDPSIGLAASGMGNIAAFTATNTGNAPVVATVTVTPNSAGGGPATTTFSNNGNIEVPSVGTTSGPANPYPSTINVTGLSGPITKVTVTLKNMNHTFPADIDILLVGPGGQNIVFMSDAGGGTDLVGTNLTFDDAATANLGTGAIVSGTYLPTNIGTTADAFSAPAPATTTPIGNVPLSIFNGTTANGVWSMYIMDDAGGDIGNFTGGWDLTISASAGSACPGVPKTFTYTVNPTPAVNSVPNKTECNNTTTAPIAFSSPTTGGTVTYNWTNSNPAIGLAASGSGNIPAYMTTNPGTAPITATISVTPSYSNAGVTCVGTASTFTITVNPTPNVNQPANQIVCVGEMTAPVTFAGTVPGTTFEWMNSNTATGLAASGTGNIAAFTTTNTTNAPLVSTVTVTPYFGAAGGGLQPELLHYKFNGSGTTVPNLALTPPAGTATATISGGQSQGGTGICDGTLIGTGATSTTDFVNTNWATNLTGTSWTLSVKLANMPSGTFAYVFGDNTAGSFRCFSNGAAGTDNLLLRGPINDVILTGGAQAGVHTSTFVYDAVAGNIKGYLDGALVTTVAQTPVAISGAGPFKVGGYAGSGGLPAGALLDEFRLYSRALSAADVQALTACVNTSAGCAGPAKTFTITVNPVLSITCPANQTLTSAVGSCSAVATYAPVVTGAPAPVITYSFSGATTGSGSGTGSGRSFNVGVTTVTLTATNVCGTKTCSFTITVNDGQLPVITTQPTTRSACESGNTTLSVTATNAVSYQWEFYNGTTWVAVAGATSATYTVNNLVRNSNTNTYRVKVIGLCTTLTSTTATIFVLAKPEVSIVSNQTLLIPGSRFVLMAVTDRPAGTGSYVWFKNGVVIPGVTGGTLPAGNIDDRGTYKVTYTDANGCVNTSADFIIGSIPTTEIFVYPNPSNGQFQIRYNNLSNEEATIFIYNARGQVIYQRKMPTGTQTYGRLDVNISNMAAGTYIIKLINGAGRVLGSKRIIKSN